MHIAIYIYIYIYIYIFPKCNNTTIENTDNGKTKQTLNFQTFSQNIDINSLDIV